MCWSTCFAASPKYAEDWGFFWNKIELAYPMLPFLEKQGVSVTVLKEDSWNEIQSCTDDDSFLRVMRKVCAKMQGINHLRIMDSEELQRLMGPYLDIRRKEGKELFFDDLGVTSTEDKAEVASIRCSYISDSQIILIQIPAFSIEHMEADKKVLGSFLSEHSEATSIIFDVSSNTGGYGFYWQEVILPFFGGIWVDSVDVFFKDKDEVLVQFATGDFSEEDIKSVDSNPSSGNDTSIPFANFTTVLFIIMLFVHPLAYCLRMLHQHLLQSKRLSFGHPFHNLLL